MSNPQLFFEAVDTAITIGRAAVGWLIFLATVATILVLAAIATGAWAVTTVWQRTVGPSWARGGLRARIHTRTRLSRSSGRTDAPDYEEAA